MIESMMWPIFGSLFILAFWGLSLVSRSLRERTRLRELEIANRERIEAMERGLPVPDRSSSYSFAPPDPEQAVYWFRTVALAIGLFLLCAGAGMVVAFALLPDFRDIWAVGFVPCLGGLGLLVFYAMSRGLMLPGGRQ